MMVARLRRSRSPSSTWPFRRCNRCPAKGSWWLVCAVGVDGAHGLIHGGYGAPPGRCMLGRLGHTQVEPIAECRLVSPDGEPLAGDAWRPWTVTGRGPVLHAFDGRDWYSVDLRDAVD